MTDPPCNEFIFIDEVLVKVEDDCCCCCWLKIEFIFNGDESALQTTRVIVGACLIGDENDVVVLVLRKSAVFICDVVEEALLLEVVIFGY